VTPPDEKILPDPLGEAAGWLREGGLLAYPTETVWGLGADASSEQGLARLRLWKGRELEAPISVLVQDADAARELGFELGSAAAELASRFWPGPLTLVVPSPPELELAAGIAREDGAVGLRCSSHPLAAALARRAGREGVGPITATSLNRAGSDPARSLLDARSLCHSDASEEPHLIGVEGAEAGGDEASTVVDLTAEEPRVLRWGAVKEEELAPLLRELGGS
jgi:L-threonylcarbamoyladenylate synthase